MEDGLDDNTVDGYLGNLGNNPFLPFTPTNYNAVSGQFRQNLGFPAVADAASNAAILAQKVQPTQSTSAPQNRNAPLQLGSGSLGYLRLSNGAVYLGSGSLGYVNDRQRANEIQDARNRQSPGPSTLTFGQSPEK